VRQVRWVCIAFAIDADVLAYSRCFEAFFFQVHMWASEGSKIVDPASQIFLGLGLMAFGLHGLSIEEVDDYNICRRAQSKGV
jgi:hypothetical protein